MPTEITHNKPPLTPLLTQRFRGEDSGFNVPIPDGSRRAVGFVGRSGRGRIEFYATEPEPIPMSAMKPGEIGQIVAAADSFDSRIGDWMRCVAWEGSVMCCPIAGRLDADLDVDCYTVRILPPGESLTVTVVKDCKIEKFGENPGDEVDASFTVVSDVADGEYTPPPMSPCDLEVVDKPGSLVVEVHGVDENDKAVSEVVAVPPETLDHALRHGTAEEMDSISRATDSQYADVFLDAVADAHRELWREYTHAGRSLVANLILSGSRDESLRRAVMENTEVIAMAEEFVYLRGALDLFGEEE